MRAVAWLAVVPVLLAAAFAAIRWTLCVVTVRGPSMEPALADGDRLLARRCGVRGLRRGQLVIFREPGLPHRRPAWLTGAGQDLWVVKRIAAVAGDTVPECVRAATGGALVVPRRTVVVLGDGARSRDSREWGFVAASQILGTCARRLGRGRQGNGSAAVSRH